MLKTSIAIAATLISTAAFAQTTPPTALIEITDGRANVAVIGSTVDQAEDMEVFDTDGNKLAEVEEVLGTDADTPTALAVDLENHDGDDVIIELADIEFINGRLITQLTADQLRALPTWND